MRHGIVRLFGIGLVSLALASSVAAQPDPSQMSGLPLPDGELPDGTISVRVIRGQLANNVTDHPVDLHQGDIVTTATTDANGRATFLTLNPGVEVYAVTELDGQRIQSQRFEVPGRGGVRLMLVGAADPTVPVQPVEQGYVTFGNESWIQIELGEETVEVYYLLDVLNMAQVPVEPEEPIVFDVPPGAEAATVLPGSSPRTIAEGSRVELPGPFPPGTTPLRVGYVLPYASGGLAVSQRFPANLEALVMMVEKWGTMDVASAQISRRGDLSAEESGGAPYLLAGGPLIVAGEPLAFELTGLPHHNRMPTNLALAVAAGMLAIGTWGAFAPARAAGAGATAKRRLAAEARKERLFADLVKVERQRRAGKIGSTKHSTRRQELLTALERVYQDLDDPSDAITSSTNLQLRPAHD